MEKKSCIQCGREIDAIARICPFCNADQVEGVRPPPSLVSVAPPDEPLPEIRETPTAKQSLRAKLPRNPWSLRVLIAVAVVIALTAAFALGAIIYGFGHGSGQAKVRTAQASPEGAPVRDLENLNIQLVPAPDPTSTIGRSITSAPLPDPDHKTEGQPQNWIDATALPSEEYARRLQVANEAAKQAAATQEGIVADPRNMTEPAVRPQPRPPQTQPARPPAERRPAERPSSDDRGVVRPVPVSQPLPDLRGAPRGTMRLSVRVGTDGRVKEVRIIESVPGMAPKMIAAVQRWRFRPATRNGQPIEYDWPVEITFQGQ